MSRRLWRLAAAMAAALVLAPTLAAAQADTMSLEDGKVFRIGTRAPVEFTHLTHMSLGGDCTDCHHRYEKGRPRENVLDLSDLQEGNPSIRCASCHTTPAALQKAFHRQCIDCHERLSRQAKPTGPRLCGECHAWKR
jgi:c(7)-type cytochrome triheme protein